KRLKFAGRLVLTKLMPRDPKLCVALIQRNVIEFRVTPQDALLEERRENSSSKLVSQDSLVLNLRPVLCQTAFLVGGELRQDSSQSAVLLSEQRVGKRHRDFMNILCKRIIKCVLHTLDLHVPGSNRNGVRVALHLLCVDEQLRI